MAARTLPPAVPRRKTGGRKGKIPNSHLKLLDQEGSVFYNEREHAPAAAIWRDER